MMKRSWLYLAVTSVLFVTMTLVSHAEYTITQLTNNTYYDGAPAINNKGQIAWVFYDPDNGMVNAELYFNNGSTTIQVPDPTGNGVSDPKINDIGQIIWQCLNGDAAETELCLYNGSTTVLLPNSTGGINQQINNQGQVVWETWNGEISELYFNEGSTTIQLPNTANDGHYHYPQINNSGQVVWQGADGIYLQSGNNILLLPDSDYRSRAPRINDNGQVAWGGKGCDGLRLYSNSITIRLPNSAGACGLGIGAINNKGQVVWQDAGGVYLYDGGTTILLPGSASNGYPIGLNDNGQVIWTDDTSNIYIYDGRSTVQLTHNGSNDNASPQINNKGQIVWAGSWEIYIATPQGGTTTPTGTGSNVSARMVDNAGTVVTVKFSEVTQSGITNLTTSSTGPAIPPDVTLGSSPTYYDISTTAAYTSPVTVCISYDPPQYFNPFDLLRLLHYENGSWNGDSTSNDTTNHWVCRQVDNLSPFVIAQALYHFNGFFQPVDNLSVFNQVKAGSGIPVKFSLKGNQGMALFAAGYPGSRQVLCQTGVPIDPIEETVTAGSSSLTYDPATDIYIYVWKTDKTWANSCRELNVKLIDGTSHTALFNFTK